MPPTHSIGLFLLLGSIFLIGPAAVRAQSGRIKPAETPPPSRTIYVPPRTMPTPRPSTTRPREVIASADGDDVIKVESTLIPIPVSVLDSSGRPLDVLTLSDFSLKIDGEPAELSELSRSETPIRLAMLFDNSSSVLIAREFEKNAAIKFFRRVIRPEKDLAALFSVGTATRLEQPFTKDVSSLVRAIEAFPPPIGATALLDGIVMAVDHLKDLPGRRIIVIVSDGDDTISDFTLADALGALQRANCQVYIVKTTDFENYVRTKSRAGNANIRQLAAERRMKEIADQTGGAVYSPIDEKELDAAFRQIQAELTQQYILSYYPDPEPTKIGEFRNIELSVKGHGPVSVRTRRGYFVPRR